MPSLDFKLLLDTVLEEIKQSKGIFDHIPALHALRLRDIYWLYYSD